MEITIDYLMSLYGMLIRATLKNGDIIEGYLMGVVDNNFITLSAPAMQFLSTPSQYQKIVTGDTGHIQSNPIHNIKSIELY